MKATLTIALAALMIFEIAGFSYGVDKIVKGEIFWGVFTTTLNSITFVWSTIFIKILNK